MITLIRTKDMKKEKRVVSGDGEISRFHQESSTQLKHHR